MRYSEFDKSFSLLYFIILLIELFAFTIQGFVKLHYATKPMLLISLIYFLYVKRFELNNKSRQLMFWGLLIALLGDIFILFDTIENNYVLFSLGVFSFMIVMIIYSIVFLDKKNKSLRSFGFLLGLISYLTILFMVIWHSLGNLLIPVMFYGLLLITMNYCAYLRRHNVSKISFNFVIIGALLMLISNTFVVINKFYFPLYWSHELIMSTYGISQYCLVFGLLKQNIELKHKFNIR